MTIKKIPEGEKLTFALEGRLDSTTAPELQEQIGDLAGVKELIMDMNELEYISSAGLRVMLKAQKIMIAQGSMKLVGVNSIIQEVLEMTGFLSFLKVR